MQKQLALFPQEKVCLHTDRTVFLAGDSGWSMETAMC